MNEDIIHFMNNIDFENTDEVYNIIYKLKHNWNELKKWLEEYLDGARSGLDSYDCGIGDCLDDVLKKISELEEGGNNDN